MLCTRLEIHWHLRPGTLTISKLLDISNSQATESWAGPGNETYLIFTAFASNEY